MHLDAVLLLKHALGSEAGGGAGRISQPATAALVHRWRRARARAPHLACDSCTALTIWWCCPVIVRTRSYVPG